MVILMIRPARFGYNVQTAVNNAFQHPGAENEVEIQRRAVGEFDAFVEKLTAHGIEVLVIQDTTEPHTPDSIFPNNWISFHEDGTVVLYPMFAENRRLERKQAVGDAIASRFIVRRCIDFTEEERAGKFLEGTGSMVLDRGNRIAYACRSPRTDEGLLRQWSERLGYAPVVFDAMDENGKAIYHTNVMMCVADRYAVINLDSIPEIDRALVVATLENTGKTIIPITHEQMNRFAGNMLQIEHKDGKTFLVMSSCAHSALQIDQLEQLEAYGPIIHSPLDTIEQYGGGSARCMMAEVFLPFNSSDPQQ